VVNFHLCKMMTLSLPRVRKHGQNKWVSALYLLPAFYKLVYKTRSSGPYGPFILATRKLGRWLLSPPHLQKMLSYNFLFYPFPLWSISNIINHTRSHGPPFPLVPLFACPLFPNGPFQKLLPALRTMDEH
jgi:hypothetical protein